MKKFSKVFGSITLAAMIGLLFPNCDLFINDNGNDNKGNNDKEHTVGWMDISDQSDRFNIMIVGDDGSSMYFNVDQNLTPMELYYKPEMDRDDGYTLLFKENGQLDTMVTNGHIFKFDNFDGYTYDWAVIYPDETIEYHYDQQSEVDWDRYEARYARLAGSARAVGAGQARALRYGGELEYSDIEDAIDIIGDVVGVATCVSALVLQVTWVGCAMWAIPKIASLIVDLLPKSDFDPVVSRFVDYFADAISCVGEKDVLDCISALSKLIGMFVDMDWDFLKCEEKLQGLEKIIQNGKAKELKGWLSISPAGPVKTGTTLTATYKDEKMGFQWVKDGVYIGSPDEDTNTSSYVAQTAGNYLVIAYKDGWWSDRMGNSATVTVVDRDLSDTVTIYDGNNRVDRAPFGTTLTARYSGSESGVRYEWRRSGSNVVLSTSASYAPGSGTFIPSDLCNYTVTVRATGCKSKTASVTITYRELSGTVTISPAGPVEVGTTLTATYHGREWITFLNYTWKGYGLSRGRNDVTVGSNSATFKPEEPGSYRVIVSAINNGYMGKDSANVSVGTSTVTEVAPAITTTSLPNGTVGTAYSATLTATGTTPIRWSRYIGSLPPDIRLSDSGTFSGTPSEAGTYSFSVKASNSAGSVTKAFSITIAAGGTAPTITTSSLPNGTVRTAYSAALTASGTTPITWSRESGTLPAGLTLSSAGTITGTPTASGTSSFTVKATNTRGSATKTLSITIAVSGEKYEVVNAPPLNWDDAKAEAERRGGHLATITSAAEQRTIEAILKRDGTGGVYYIGGYCESDRVFKWITGEPMTYTNWGTGEPDQMGSQDKMVMNLQPASGSTFNILFGQWDDIRNTRNGYIIEFD